MSQSSVIAGALVIAFLMFITVRGELPQYIDLFTVKRRPQKTKTSNGGGKSDGEMLLEYGSELLGDGGDDGEIPDGEQVEI